MDSRGGLAGAYRLPDQVVGEGQGLPAFSEQLAADEFVDGVEQCGGGDGEDGGDLCDGEAATHGSSDRGNPACGG